MRFSFLILLFSVLVWDSIAQTKTESYLALSVGLMSYDQIKGIVGGEPAHSIITTPYVMTAATFVTYRQFYSNRIAVGYTFGIDNQYGNLSYGNPSHNSTIPIANSGTYNRQAYTIAIECLMKYSRKERKKCQTYGFVGMGVTSLSLNYNFSDGVNNKILLYGTQNSLLPAQNNHYENIHYNFQLTPIAIRGGGKVAFFGELGFGYKGLACFGLSYNFNYVKPEPVSYSKQYFGINSSSFVMIVPFSCPTDSSYVYLGKVKSAVPIAKRSDGFEAQLENVANMATKMQGNAVKIYAVNEPKGKNRYIVYGWVYNNADSLGVQEMAGTLYSQHPDSLEARVVIFKANIEKTIRSIKDTKMCVSGKDTLAIRLQTATILKINRKGKYTFTTKAGKTIDLDIELGKCYYVKIKYHKKGFRYEEVLEQLTNKQGEIESSIKRKVTFAEF